MKSHSIIRVICALIAALCMAIAYVPRAGWLAWLGIPAAAVFWLMTKKRAACWSASSLLAIYLVLAIMGMLQHAAPAVMVVGSVFALAAWDLADFSQSLRDGLRGETGPLERRRLQSLALMVGGSLLLGVGIIGLRLQLSFGLVVLLVLLATGGLLYAVQQMRHSPAE